MPENAMLQEAIEAMRQGQRNRARDLLTRLLRADQNSAEYWLWMSAVVDSLKEQVYCLQNVLRLEPGNLQAQRGLVLLGAQTPGAEVVPVPPVRRKWQTSLEDLPKPAGLLGVWANPATRALVIGGLAVLVFGLILGGLFLENRRPRAVAVYPTRTPGPAPTFTLTPTFANVTPDPPTRTPALTPEGPTELPPLVPLTYTPTPFYVATPHGSSEAYRIAFQALKQGNLETALRNMEQALQANPKAADIQFLVGEIHRMQGNDALALEAYNQALALNPNFAPAYLGRAQMTLAMKPRADVREDLKRAIAKDPNLGEAYLFRAQVLLSQNQPGEALIDLRKAEKALPNSAWVFFHEAQAFLSTSEPAQAILAARQAVALDPGLLPAYSLLGEAYLQNEQPALAIPALQTITLYAAAPEARDWALLGQAQYEMKQYRTAIQSLEQALALEKDYPAAYRYRGLAYLELGQGQEAINDLLVARRAEARSFLVNLAYGRALMVDGRLEQARDQISFCQNLVETPGEQAALYYWRAQVLEGLKKGAEAIMDWQALLKMPSKAVPTAWKAFAEKRLAAITTATASAQPTSTPTPTTAPSPTLKPSATPAASRTPRPSATLKPSTPTPATASPTASGVPKTKSPTPSKTPAATRTPTAPAPSPHP